MRILNSICLLFCFFLINLFPVNGQNDLRLIIYDFVKAEDSRNIEKIVSNLSFPVFHWNETMTMVEVRKKYIQAWSKTGVAKNHVQDIFKTGPNTYTLVTVFQYENKSSSQSKIVRSKIKFTFFQNKIRSINLLSSQNISFSKYLAAIETAKDRDHFNNGENKTLKKDINSNTSSIKESVNTKSPLRRSDDNLRLLIYDFVKAEDNRDLEKIISLFEFPTYYWNKIVSEEEVRKQYRRVWKNIYASKNYVLQIKEIDPDNYVLETVFEHQKASNNEFKVIKSRIQFLFYNSKISHISPLSTKEVTYEEYLNAVDTAKDRSYFLSSENTSKKQTERANKEAVRKAIMVVGIILIILIFVVVKLTTKDFSTPKKEKESNTKLTSKSSNKTRAIPNSFSKQTTSSNFISEKERKRRNEKARQTRLKRQQEEIELKQERESILKAREKKESKSQKPKKERGKRKSFDQFLHDAKEKHESRKKSDDNDEYFEKNLKKYMVTFDDDEEISESAETDFLVDKYMDKELKKKLRNKK